MSPVHLSLKYQNECKFCSQLKSSYLAAHKTYYLVLLPSRPDTVHNHLLRKTQFSTLLTKVANFNLNNPRTNITLAIACKKRKLLTSQLHGTIPSITLYKTKVNNAYFVKIAKQKNSSLT